MVDKKSKQRLISQCVHKLEKIWPVMASDVVQRLTEEELKKFSQSDEEEILAYIIRNRTQSLRWRFICTCYPFQTEKGLD